MRAQPLKKGHLLNAVLQKCIQVLELVCKAVPGLVEAIYLMGKAKFLAGKMLVTLKLRPYGAIQICLLLLLLFFLTPGSKDPQG